MAHWIATTPALAALESEARAQLGALAPQNLPRGTVLFRPGDSVTGFALVLAGRIEVFLTGANGRELLLYAVEPGQSCVQSTLGLLGGGDYSTEAIVAADCDLVMIPRPLFLRLMDGAPGFRRLVFSAFAERMNDMIQLMERVAFQRVEFRLAKALLARATDDRVNATQAELAALIGSAREVVSRRLDVFARSGWVRTERGAVVLIDREALTRLARTDAL